MLNLTLPQKQKKNKFVYNSSNLQKWYLEKKCQMFSTVVICLDGFNEIVIIVDECQLICDISSFIGFLLCLIFFKC